MGVSKVVVVVLVVYLSQDFQINCIIWDAIIAYNKRKNNLTKKEQALSEVNYHDLESEATREYSGQGREAGLHLHANAGPLLI